MANFPYSIPVRRDLTEKERALVRRLLAEVAPDQVWKVEGLEVFARCGCGRCPTIIFQANVETKKSEQLLADYLGGPASAPVGIYLWERDGELSELEARPFAEDYIADWPSLNTLRPYPVDSTQ